MNVTKVRIRDGIPIIHAQEDGTPANPFVRKVIHEGASRPAPELLQAAADLRHLAQRHYQLDDWRLPTSRELGTVNWSETDDGRLKVVVTIVCMTELSPSAITLNLAFREADPDSTKPTDAPQPIVNAAQVLREACEAYLDGAVAQGDLFEGKAEEIGVEAVSSPQPQQDPAGADFAHIADVFAREDAELAGEPDPAEEEDGSLDRMGTPHRIMPNVPQARGRRRKADMAGLGTAH